MEGSGITNNFDITPLLFAIAGFGLILIVANYLGKSGSGKKLSKQVTSFISFDEMSDPRRQRKKEEAQKLLQIIEKNPYQISPSFEKLVGLENTYSRRINIQHRLVYQVDKENHLIIVKMLYKHYGQ